MVENRKASLPVIHGCMTNYSVLRIFLIQEISCDGNPAGEILTMLALIETDLLAKLPLKGFVHEIKRIGTGVR